MKRNLFNHIPVTVLVLVLCTFSFLRMNSSNQKFNPALYAELTQQQEKSIHKPDVGFATSFENLFEEQTEDETETEFNAALPILNLSQHISDLLFSVRSLASSFTYQQTVSTQAPLFLVVRSIRI